MRIDNQFLTTISLGAFVGLPRLDKSRPGARGPQPQFVTSFDLAQCQALAAQEPEVRSEVIDRVQVRLAAGFYDSAESAEHTAQAMLRDQE